MLKRGSTREFRGQGLGRKLRRQPTLENTTVQGVDDGLRFEDRPHHHHQPQRQRFANY